VSNVAGELAGGTLRKKSLGEDAACSVDTPRRGSRVAGIEYDDDRGSACTHLARPRAKFVIDQDAGHRTSRFSHETPCVGRAKNLIEPILFQIVGIVSLIRLPRAVAR
jgi:hypothetical protein